MNAKGRGAIFALVLLLACELVLHSDKFLLMYRSVFAAGRLMEKIFVIEHSPIHLLLLGNSRVDNGFDPLVLQQKIGMTAFNLGVPGANAEILYGIVTRLAEQGQFNESGITHVALGLDESLFQAGDSLGYGVFFADRGKLLQEKQFKALLHSYFRLLGYGGQLKELREPEKLLRFMKASFQDIEPMGGAAKINRGFRPGERGKFQNNQQLLAQEAGAQNPPDNRMTAYFFALLAVLQRHNVQIAVFFPPLLNRNTLFLEPNNPKAKPYLAIKKQFLPMGVAVVDITSNVDKVLDEFANAGHLNKKGSVRFSNLLAQKLLLLWSNLGSQKYDF